MFKTKQIKPENWFECVNIFTSFNKGRLVSITMCNFATLANEIPLMSIDYQGQLIGKDIVICVGDGNLKLNHIIKSPIELWETKNNIGEVTSMEIIDTDNNEVVLTFC